MLAGQSGAVEIEIGIRQNPAMDPVYFDHYALQMTIALDTELCANIVSEGGSQANAGTQKQINYTVLPESEKTYLLTMDAVDFEMDSITINAIPLNMDIDSIDTEEMKEKVHELQNGISQVHDGAATIQKATDALNDGTATLYDSSSMVQNGVSTLASGAAQLTAHSASIASSMQQLSDGLAQISASAEPLKAGGDQLNGGAQELAAGMGTLNQQFASLVSASAEIGGAIDSLSSAAAGASSDIANMKNLLQIVAEYPEITGSYGKYIASARTLVGTAEAVQSGLSDLNANYAQFHNSLAACSTAVSELSAASDTLSGGLAGYTGPMNQFIDGVTGAEIGSAAEGASQYAQFDTALRELNAGMTALDENYGALHAGISALESSIRQLKDGATDLKDGTCELSDKTGDMDTQIDDEVDEALSKFRNEDFEALSFADPRNEVRLVQFVIRTEAIELPEEEEEAIVEVATETGFLDRLTALFSEGRKSE